MSKWVCSSAFLGGTIKIEIERLVCYLACGDYAEAHFPVKLWEAGEHAVSLSEFDWNPDTRIMMFGNQDFAYGETMSKPEITEGDPARVYTLAEIKEMMEKRGMELIEAFAGYTKIPASQHDFQMLVHSRKRMAAEV